RWVPPQLASSREQRVAKLDRLDEPLPARDDLERTVPFFVELDGVRHRPRLADEIPRFAELLDDFGPRFRRRQPHDIAVVTAGPLRIGRFPPRRSPIHLAQRAVGLYHRAHRQVELAPPHDVRHVAEGAY